MLSSFEPIEGGCVVNKTLESLNVQIFKWFKVLIEFLDFFFFRSILPDCKFKNFVSCICWTMEI